MIVVVIVIMGVFEINEMVVTFRCSDPLVECRFHPAKTGRCPVGILLR